MGLNLDPLPIQRPFDLIPGDDDDFDSIYESPACLSNTLTTCTLGRVLPTPLSLMKMRSSKEAKKLRKPKSGSRPPAGSIYSSNAGPKTALRKACTRSIFSWRGCGGTTCKPTKLVERTQQS